MIIFVWRQLFSCFGLANENLVFALSLPVYGTKFTFFCYFFKIVIFHGVRQSFKNENCCILKDTDVLSKCIIFHDLYEFQQNTSFL